MRASRFVLSCVVLFLVALVWNGVLHLVLLRDAEEGIRSIYRPELGDRLWLSLAVTAAIVVLFVWGYGRFARGGSLREGAAYGFFFAFLAGVLVDFTQWVLFPIPGRLALLWFAGGIGEFVLYGVIVSRLDGRSTLSLEKAA